MKRVVTLLSLGWLISTAPLHAGLEPKIIFETDPTLLTTTLELVVLTGSEDDPGGKGGVAHLMSELMLRGTKKRKRNVFQSELERLGAAIGVRTTHDSIIFVGKVIKENTLPFLKLVEDFLLQPAFTKPEFESLKTEVMAEIANRKNNNTRLAGLALRKQFYSGTVLERSVEGGLNTVKQITHDDVQWAYNNRVHQGSVVFGIATPFKEAELKKLFVETWLKLPDGARKTRKSVPAHVPQKPTLIVVHKANTSTGSLVIGQPGITAQDPTRFVLGTANYSFGGEPLVSRLFKTIRAELGWTYFIGSNYQATGPLTYQQGIFVISGIPSIEFTTKTLMKVRSMWADYIDTGLKSEELSLAHDGQINSYPFDFDSAEKRLAQRMQSYLYGVPLLSPEEYGRKIAGISNSEIKSVLKQKHSPKNLLISIVADKAVIAKQLEAEQKDIAPENRLTISRVLTPEEVIQ